MESLVDILYHGILEVIETLIDMDPPEDSPEGKLLLRLAAITEEYEKKRYPDLCSKVSIGKNPKMEVVGENAKDDQ